MDIVLEEHSSPGLPQFQKKNLYLMQLKIIPRKHLNSPKRETSREESKVGRTPMQVAHKTLFCQEKWLLLFKTAENLQHIQFNFKPDFSNQTWMPTGKASLQVHLTSYVTQHNALLSDTEYNFVVHSHQSP